MTKKLYYFFILISALIAQNSLSLPDVEGDVGDSLIYNVYVDNEESFVGFQFDIELNESLSLDFSSPELTSRAVDHTLQVIDLGENRFRFFSFSQTQSNFSGQSGSILTFQIFLNANPGSFQTQLFNPVLGNENSVNIVSSFSNGQITVIGSKAIYNPTIIDLGRVALESEQSFEFTIHNDGNSSLIINNIQPSTSDITIQNLQINDISAGDFETITLLFATENRGPISENILITTNEFSNEIHTIDVIGESYAVNQLIAGDVFGRSGYEVELKLEINNMDSICGFSSDIIFPEVISYSGGEILLSDRAVDHVINANQINVNTLRVVSYSNTNKFFRGISGEIASIKINLEGPAGNYPINIENSILSDSNIVNVLSDEISSSATIISPEMVILDTSIIFTETSIFDTSTFVLNVDNIGMDTLTIDSIFIFDEQFFTHDLELPLKIPPSNRDSLNIKFFSHIEGNFSSIIRLVSNDPFNSVIDLELNGNSFIPNIIGIISDSVKTESSFYLDFWIENNEECLGFQFDLIIPTGFTFLDSIITTEPINNFETQYSLIDSSTLRVFSYSTNQISKPLGKSVILKILFNSSESSGIFNFNLDSIIIGNSGSENIYSGHLDGFIFVRTIEARNIKIDDKLDNYHVTSLNPVFSFVFFDSYGGDQTNYHIQVSSDSLWIESDLLWDTGIIDSNSPNTTYNGTPMTDGMIYYIRIKVANDTFWSDWAYTSFRLNTPPTTPILISPINNIVTTPPTTLIALNSTDAEEDNITYSFYVFEDALMETRLDSVIGITSNQDTIKWQIEASLADNGQYYWYASSFDGYESSSSQASSFILNIVNDIPAEFSLVNPTDSIDVTTLLPLFDWEVAFDPDPLDTARYKLYLDKPEPGVVIIHTDTSTNFEIQEPLQDNTTYYWKVVAMDLSGATTENAGGYHSFRVNTQNDPPTLSTLIAPLQGSIQTDIRPTFYWSEAHDPDPFDHVSYSIEWWPVNETDVMFIEDVDTNTFTPEFDLSDNAKFGWRVTAKDIEGLSSMTDSSYFFTDAFPEPPLAFNTVYPENNAEGLGTSIDFVWNKTIDPDPLDEVTYQLVYGTDWQDSSTYLFSDIITDTSISVLLDDNIQYYWVVVARDADGFIVGSNNDTPNMVTVGTLSVDNNTVPTVFALYQNYPNPFNPTTQIRYDLPERRFVSIIIYDVMGRKIKSLININQEAGYRSITWNATNDLGQPVSAGVYIYTIQAGEFRQTRKMVLLK